MTDTTSSTIAVGDMTNSISDIEIIRCELLTQLPKRYYPFPKWRYPTPADALAEASRLFGLSAGVIYDWPGHDGKHGFWAMEAEDA